MKSIGNPCAIVYYNKSFLPLKSFGKQYFYLEHIHNIELKNISVYEY